MAEVRRPSFAAGEIGPTLTFRDDLARHQIAVRRAENMMVLPEGGLTRTPGTRFVLPLKAEAEVAELFPFRYSGEDAYFWVINGGKVRLVRGGGFVESSPGVPFEFDVPWVAADLDKLRALRIDHRVIAVAEGYQPRLITRNNSHTLWTVESYAPAGGPVGAQNLDTAITIRASAVSGNGVTLAGVGTAFDANDIGGVYRLDEPDLNKVPTWQSNETLLSPETALPAVTAIGDMGGLPNAFDGNTIQVAAAGASRLAANDCYVGQNFGAAPQPISRARVFGSSDQGFASTNGALEIRLYGRVSGVPVNGTDGVQLGSLKFTDTASESGGRYVYSNDALTAFQCVWVYLASSSEGSETLQGSGLANLYVAELQLLRWTTATPTHQRRHGGRVYVALNDGDAGAAPPTHEEGDASSGRFNIAWRFKHDGHGFVRITAVASALGATGDVIGLLPDSVRDYPTYRWFAPAWSPRAGWPKRIAQVDGRVLFARDAEWWLTRPVDPFSLELRDLAIAAGNPDTAIAVKMLPPDNGGLPFIEWALSAGVLILGERDRERIIRTANQFDPLTIDKLKPVPGASEGSAPHVPVEVDDGVIFIGRSRKRLHFGRFDALPDKLVTEEITIANRRILRGNATHLAFERDPHRLLYVRCADDSMRMLSFMPAQQVIAWTRRITQNGAFERASSLPTLDEGSSDTIFVVRRTIRGATRRYVEHRAAYFEPASGALPTAEGAWFLDCALRYQGAAVNTVSGAAHLAEQTVGVFADGAMRPNAVVTPDGAVTFEGKSAVDVLVGIPMTSRVLLLPIEVEGQRPSKGKIKSAYRVVLDLVESLGGKVRVNGGEWEDFLPTGTNVPAAPLALFSGSVPVDCEGEDGMLAEIEILIEHAGPFTLAGVTVSFKVDEADAEEPAALQAEAA